MSAPQYNGGGFGGQGYPPPQQGYPPPQQGYGPPQGGYGPPQGGYGPPQGYGAAPGQEMQMQPSQQGGPVGAPVQGEDGTWMGQVAQNQVPVDCPPGLEYLVLIDQLIIKQKVEMLEAVAGVMGYGFETANKYKIKNSLGQNVYKAKEETECCTRMVCGPARPFDMAIYDNAEQEVLHLNRPLACSSCCFPCCLQSIEVCAPPGNTIGFVNQKWTCIKPKFEITDGDGNVALVIKGPWCTYSCAGDVEFKVMTPDESVEVGRISKQWSGLLKEAFTDTDNFGITFPMDLDVRCKATLIGAAFLIDYMFFEKKANNENDGAGML